jgi:hypothetical protein
MACGSYLLFISGVSGNLFVGKNHSDSNKMFSEINIIKMLVGLIENQFPML